MRVVTLTEIKRFNQTEGRCNGDYMNDCLPDGMTTEDLTCEHSLLDDGDSPYHVMPDPESDLNGYNPVFNYKDPSKLIGVHIDEDTGFYVSDEVCNISRIVDEPLPYDDDDEDPLYEIDTDDELLPYDETRL
ncbi:hypothetical protein MUY32_14380 [Enterobacter roggenkampii]|uniref:hypothetical protein n=1 Tax=Enterobacter roggenkampii TaxID=1812935 RepID=UPI002019ED09|nr:hypothetical protein [Enterobacter roggenkampii]UQQ40216.1 hypothetical protein MUY32_14380 [Enterobacter roggenkampii]